MLHLFRGIAPVQTRRSTFLSINVLHHEKPLEQTQNHFHLFHQI